MKVKAFLGALDHERIVAAIREAESRSRGEVRVHVDRGEVKDAQQAAAAAFERLGMTATRERNGVLLFVAPRSQRFAILGDQGIHAKSGDAVWTAIAAAVAEAFRAGRFADGIVEAVRRVGDELERHFPRQAGRADVDELPNEVSQSD